MAAIYPPPHGNVAANGIHYAHDDIYCHTDHDAYRNSNVKQYWHRRLDRDITGGEPFAYGESSHPCQLSASKQWPRKDRKHDAPDLGIGSYDLQRKWGKHQFSKNDGFAPSQL